MMTIAFGLLVLTGIVYALFSQVSRQTEDVDMAQLRKFGNALIETVNKLSYMGDTSSLTIEQVFPSGIVNVTLDRTSTAVLNRTILFWYKGANGISQVEFRSPVDIALDFTNFNKGTKKIVVSDLKGKTLICLKTTDYSCNGFCDFSHLEDAFNSPSDCCTSMCYGCTTQDRKPTACINDSKCHSECYGHNGCMTIC